MFFSEENSFDDLTDKEKQVLKKHELCILKKKPYQVFCKQCKRLVCNTCYFNQHREHTVVESDDHPCQIYEIIKSETENLSNQRLCTLKGKVKKLDDIFVKLNKLDEISGCFEQITQAFVGFAEKNENFYAKNLKIWIKKCHAKTIEMKDEIINRLNHEKQESSKFFLGLKEKNYKPMIKSVLCQKFIEKKMIQQQNDEEYVVEDLPSITKQIRKNFETMISEVLEQILMNYMKSMSLLDESITDELFQEVQNCISECSTAVLEKYKGDGSEESFKNSEKQSLFEIHEKNETGSNEKHSVIEEIKKNSSL